jgi:predicted permease
MGEFFRRIYFLFNRRKLERELQNDIDFHREMLSAESRKDFGNLTLMRERSREAWGWGWLDRLAQDLRFGARLLRKSPALAVTAICVLALGIGVNVSAFNLVDVMFFKPLPVRDPHTLVRFSAKAPTMSAEEVPYSAAMYYRENNSALSAVLAQASTNLTLTGETNENLHASLVTSNYFSELGATAAYGRLFDAKTDDAPDSEPVAVLGYRYWQNRFAGDPTMVGKTIRLNQHPATVIGVTSYAFSGLDPEHGEADGVWLIISKFAYFVPDTKMLTSFSFEDSGIHMSARLKPGVTLKAAEASLAPISHELVGQHRDVMPKDMRLIAKPGAYAVNLDPADAGLLSMFGLFATLVLLILATACSNLGNLLLGHAANRAREISIRLSLGATRRRIVRQLMTENLLLALLGSAAGLFMSWILAHPLVVWLGAPSNLNLGPDWRTWSFTVGVGVFACLLFGLPPSKQAASQARGKKRARMIFMSTQVAASCVLLVVSALLVRALYRASNSDLGFDYAHLITVDPQLYAHGYTPQKAANYNQELQARLQAAPGVASTALTLNPPLGNRVSLRPAGGEISVNLHFNYVSPRFFETMAISLLRGRDFTKEDSGKDLAIVSEAAARNIWPGKDPLQQTFKYGQRTLQVVGLAGNARLTALRNGDDAVLYMPMGESKMDSATMLVRTSQAPRFVLSMVTDLARAADPALSPQVQAVETALQDRMSDSQKFATVVSGLGSLALVLAAVGLYGVVAYGVAQRTKEIGIRIALGATPGTLVRNMLSGFAVPLAWAIGAGLLLAAGLSMVLREFLYGVSNWDPLSYLGAVVLLAVTGGLAALIPGRRALKVDPMEALRCE